MTPSISGLRLPDKLRCSTYLNAFNAGKGAKFFQLASNVPYTYSAVMRRTVDIPLVHEISCPQREAIAAVGISDLEDRARNRFALGDQQFQLSINRLDHRQQGDRPVLD